MTTAEQLEVLEGALSLLADPKRWTKGTEASSLWMRRMVPPQSDAAARWCLWGAKVRVGSDCGISARHELGEIYMNDHGGYVAVLDGLCARIDELRELQGVEA